MAEFQLIDETITLIAALEGCKLIAYSDVTGFAIGYGSHKHLDGSTVKKGDTITQEEAIKLLKQRVENEFFPHAKRILTNSKINSYQAGAVTSLIYNCGTGKITSKSSVIKAINANPDDPKIKDLFAEWRLSGGKVCEGLCIRRAREYEFYKNKKINMNVPYVYNSDLGGYAVNDESDAVVGNSKNETKYINTNYCASIKCYDEPEPVVGNGDYENYSESGDAMVNNPLVYKGNEAISIVNSLKGGGYIIENFDKHIKSNYLWYRGYIKEGSNICAILQIYLFSDSSLNVYVNVKNVDIKLMVDKINKIVNESNAALTTTKFNKLEINEGGTYSEKLQKLKQYIINNPDLPNIDKVSTSPQENFNIFCMKNIKTSINWGDFYKNIFKKNIVNWNAMTGFGITYEKDRKITDDNYNVITTSGGSNLLWDEFCLRIMTVLTNKYEKNLPSTFYMWVQKLGLIHPFFNLTDTSPIGILKFSDNKCVVFNYETGAICKKHNKNFNDFV
jgi:GH24 family phage-related lysozyme (muramidase)